MGKDKEIEVNDSKEYVEASYPLDEVRFAYTIFIPNVEQDPRNPTMTKAMQVVKFQASKVAFKYEQEDNWVYYYGLVVDSEDHGCSQNGTSAVMIKMPYSIKNEAKAKEDLIIFVKEIAVLCGIEDVVLNYNFNTAFHIHCEYNDENKCIDTFDSYTYEELKVDINISCNIEENIQFAGIDIYDAITAVGNTLNPFGVAYYKAGMFVYCKDRLANRCQMVSSNVQVQSLGELKISKTFKESIEKEIEVANLKINNYTVI